MAQMFTYTTTGIGGDELRSNRYGTIEAIRARFGNAVDIVDAPPVEVSDADACPYWPGFAKQSYKP